MSILQETPPLKKMADSPPSPKSRSPTGGVKKPKGKGSPKPKGSAKGKGSPKGSPKGSAKGKQKILGRYYQRNCGSRFACQRIICMKK